MCCDAIIFRWLKNSFWYVSSELIAVNNKVLFTVQYQLKLVIKIKCYGIKSRVNIGDLAGNSAG